MGPGTASRFRAVLELAGGLTLATALGMSMLVQVRVWRAVRSDGDGDEHDDFKIRTEQRWREEMKQALEAQDLIIEKLIVARAVLSKEKADVKAMHDHDQPPNDAEDVTSRTDPNRTTFANPLTVDDNGVDDGEETTRD